MTKTALITGATGGLGTATCHYLIARGWEVVAADFDRNALEQIEGSEGVSTVFIDVTDTAASKLQPRSCVNPKELWTRS